MAVTSDPRFLLTRWSAGTDPFTRAQLDDDLRTLDQYAARAENGTLAARPAAGIVNRFYVITGDTADRNGTVYYDDGAAWSVVKAASSVPVGAVLPFAGSVAPSGYLMAFGQSLAKDAYPELYAAVGDAFGATTTNFALPDLRGRVPVGLDNIGGSDAGRIGDANTLGAAVGAEAAALTAAQLPAHQHAIDHDHGNVGTSGQSADHSHSGGTSANGDHQHYEYVGDVGGLGGGGTLVRKGYSNPGDVTSGGGNHSHSFGTSGASSDHGHNVDLPIFYGGSGNGPGTASPVSRMQPGQLLNYIVRALP